MKKFLYAFSGILLLLGRWAAAQTGPASDGRTLAFIPNKGQWPTAVRYSGAVPGGHLYLEPTGLHYVLLQAIKHPHEAIGGGRAGSAAPRPPAADSLVRGHQVRVRFVGADLGTPLVPAEATGEVFNYLQGNDPAHWAKGVTSYRQVRYQAPWPGIGARFYENARQQLEYDFELAADANPALVQLKYEGASRLSLSRDGRLHVGTTVGDLTELAPQAYQTDAATGERQPVACRYRLRTEDSTVTFELGRYDHHRPLTIDPTVQFSTYTGARGDNWGFTATYDAAGNMYSGGIVLANGLTPAYPTTTGAFQIAFGGLIDIAVIKYNTAVSGAAARVWATYVGGDSQDFPSSLVVNNQNELLILGTSSSSNYPTTTGAFQRSFGGGTAADPFGDGAVAPLVNIYNVTRGTDIVITRLASNGGSLAASTYLGGSGTDGLVPYDRTSAARQLPQNYGDAFRGDIITDALGNVYVASVTTSTNFPVTAGSFGTSSRGGSSDAVVVKLPPSLGTPIWSGYLGGNAADAAYSLQLDASSNVYVTGGTLSGNFPVTAGAVNLTAPGNVDGFVTRIAANGASVLNSTYLGTSSYDQSYFLQLGADGGVYLLGQTLGAWPVTAGVYSNPGSRQFIQKLSPNLDQRLLSTVFGSGRTTIDISPTAFLVDQCDRVYVCGWGGNVNQSLYTTASPYNVNGYTHGMPVTPNAVRGTPDTPNAGSDFYLAQFTPGLTGLLYGTFYGDATPFTTGDHVDGGTSRFDPRGVAYAAVCSCFDATGFPVPLGANTYSTANGTSGTNCNNAAFKLNFEPQIAIVGADQSVCASAGPVALTGSPAGGTWSGPGVSGSVATGFFFTPTTALVGVQTLIYTITGVAAVCTATGTQHITVTPAPTAALNALPQATYCLQVGVAIAPIALVGAPAGGVFSGPGVSGNQFSPAVAGAGRHTITYTVGVGLPCPAVATRVVTVAAASAGAALTVCPGSSAVPLTGSPTGGTWSGPGVSGSVGAGFVFTPSPALSGTTQTLTYSVNAPDSSCVATATRTITIATLLRATVPGLPNVCAGTGPLALPLGSPTGGVWSGPGVSTSGTGQYVFTPTLALAGLQTLTYTVTSAQNCQGQATTTILVLPAAVMVMPADTVLCPGSSRAFQLHASPAGGSWSGPGVTASGLFTPPLVPGIAAVVYTVGTGTPCPVSATRRITLLGAPTLVPTAQPLTCRIDSAGATINTPAIVPYTVVFSQPTTTLLADAVITWDFGDGSAPATGFSVTHTYLVAGTYQPTATLRFNNGRCSAQVSLAPIVAQAMLIPNVFTPNGDNLNNFFAPRIGGCRPRLEVYSRWGQRVYASPAYANNWDGAGQAAGLYYFLLTPADGSPAIKGWVELIR